MPQMLITWEVQEFEMTNKNSQECPKQSPGRLDYAFLRTFFYEAMSNVNSQPLTTDNINDTKGLEPRGFFVFTHFYNFIF